MQIARFIFRSQIVVALIHCQAKVFSHLLNILAATEFALNRDFENKSE